MDSTGSTTSKAEEKKTNELHKDKYKYIPSIAD